MFSLALDARLTRELTFQQFAFGLDLPQQCTFLTARSYVRLTAAAMTEPGESAAFPPFRGLRPCASATMKGAAHLPAGLVVHNRRPLTGRPTSGFRQAPRSVVGVAGRVSVAQPPHPSESLRRLGIRRFRRDFMRK